MLTTVALTAIIIGETALITALTIKYLWLKGALKVSEQRLKTYMATTKEYRDLWLETLERKA